LIFDTSTVLKILKDEKFLESLKISEEVKITSITVYELLRGASYIKLVQHSDKEINVILKLISELNVLPFTEEDARIASAIWAKLKKEGKTVSDADVLIASICINNNERLVTLDTDFLKVKEVCKEFKVEIAR